MESFFFSLKTEEQAARCGAPDEAKAEVFDCVERIHNQNAAFDDWLYISPTEFERRAGLRRASMMELAGHMYREHE